MQIYVYQDLCLFYFFYLIQSIYRRIQNDLEIDDIHTDYSYVYEMISKKYTIPIWSLREVVWSNTSDTFMLPYISILRYLCQSDQNPGYSFHSYMADLLAISLEYNIPSHVMILIVDLLKKCILFNLFIKCNSKRYLSSW